MHVSLWMCGLILSRPRAQKSSLTWVAGRVGKAGWLGGGRKERKEKYTKSKTTVIRNISSHLSSGLAGEKEVGSCHITAEHVCASLDESALMVVVLGGMDE
ncbi:hypothetical protein HDK77DRAFT_222553 [Phyllosticta capitalensis]